MQTFYPTNRFTVKISENQKYVTFKTDYGATYRFEIEVLESQITMNVGSVEAPWTPRKLSPDEAAFIVPAVVIELSNRGFDVVEISKAPDRVRTLVREILAESDDLSKARSESYLAALH